MALRLHALSSGGSPMPFKIDLVEQGYSWPETTIWRQLAWKCGLDVDDDDLLPVLLALLVNNN